MMANVLGKLWKWYHSTLQERLRMNWFVLVTNRDVEAVDFQAASTASDSASNLQFKY